MPAFTADQQAAYNLANRERRIRGLPDFTAPEFVRCRPMQFPSDVDPDTMTAQASPADPAPLGSRRDRMKAEAERKAAEIKGPAE